MAASEYAISLAKKATAAAVAKHAIDPIAFDVSERLAITDIFLIVSGNTERQVGALVDGITEALLKDGVKLVRREGDRDSRWVLLDYLDIIIHVQHAEQRSQYCLERLWKDCPEIKLTDETD